MGLLLFKTDFDCFFQVVIVTVLAFQVIEQPTLIGKTVFQVWQGKRKYVIYRFDGCKESPVRSFLKTEELDDTQAFVRHLLPYLGYFENIWIAEVQFDRTGGIDRLADIVEKQHVHFRQFGQPGNGNHRQSHIGKSLLQTFPDTVHLGIVRADRHRLIIKQRKRFSFR